EAMLITGLQRLDLTAAEESKAYEDAVLEGLDVTAIAKATGRKAATIKGRLKLSVLSDDAKTSLHTGQLTIGDAEAMASFSDDADATKALEAELGTPGFAQTLRVLEMHRKIARETETKVKAAEKAGLPKVEHDSPSWSYGTGPYPLSYFGRAEQDLALHVDAGCAGWCVHYERFYEVCTDPASHRDEDPEVDEAAKALQQSEWEKQQETREEQRVAGIAAMQLRLELLRDHLAATVTAQSLGKTAIGMLRLTLPTTIEGDAPVEGFMHLMGIESAKPYGWQDDWLETHWPSATDAFVVQVWVAILAAQLDDVLLDDRTDNPDLRLAAWDWYSAISGAAMSDVDTALYAEAEAALDADDHSAKAS
ncbi:MAG: hypothetical protein JWO46_1829, partial [Nocardioidaceae bacterium]|nr:hypothetical protein [Nocardioidaceae bacterium]